MAETRGAYGKKPRRCRNCHTIFDNTVPRSRKYCGIKCQKEYLKAIKLARKVDQGIPAHTDSGVYVEAFKKLAFENLEDDIRETLREETRKQVTQHLKDNILGATEALTALLPSVMNGLAHDIEHEDWMRRSRAQALVMKYAFAYKDAPEQGEDRFNINIIHGVPVPDSPFGDHMIEDQEDRIEAQTEARMVPASEIDPDADPDEYIELPEEQYEARWPRCQTCGGRKHPGTFYQLNKNQTSGQCRTCQYSSGVRTAFKVAHKPGSDKPMNDETADWDKSLYGPDE